MDTHPQEPAPGVPAQEVNTLVVGAGRAGLAVSYWLSQFGVEHRLLERRPELGGAWQDRWDAFCLNTPNFSLGLPGSPYGGDSPDAFMLRDAAVDYFRSYALAIEAPVLTGTEVTRIQAGDGGFSVETSAGTWESRNVVLATGAYHQPKIPALAASLPSSLVQLHSHDYRNPGQLPACTVAGTCSTC